MSVNRYFQNLNAKRKKKEREQNIKELQDKWKGSNIYIRKISERKERNKKYVKE